MVWTNFLKNEVMSFIITPEVNSSQEFIEIAQDFLYPLDLVREGISNGFDAHAKNMIMDFSVIQECGERLLKIEIIDDGDGMDDKEYTPYQKVFHGP